MNIMNVHRRVEFTNTIEQVIITYKWDLLTNKILYINYNLHVYQEKQMLTANIHDPKLLF